MSDDMKIETDVKELFVSIPSHGGDGDSKIPSKFVADITPRSFTISAGTAKRNVHLFEIVDVILFAYHMIRDSDGCGSTKHHNSVHLSSQCNRSHCYFRYFPNRPSLVDRCCYHYRPVLGDYLEIAVKQSEILDYFFS
jgi:hypothetical protein